MNWELYEPQGRLPPLKFLTELLCRVYRTCGLERTLAFARRNEANDPQYVLFSKIQRSVIPTQLMDAGTEDCGKLRRYIHLNPHLICSIRALKQKYKGKYS